MPANPIAIPAQLACVDRELALRRRVYPALVHAGRMTQQKMDTELATMEAVRATLELHTPQTYLFPTEVEELRAMVARLEARYAALAAPMMTATDEERK